MQSNLNVRRATFGNLEWGMLMRMDSQMGLISPLCTIFIKHYVAD
jgi:hypothetical protein